MIRRIGVVVATEHAGGGENYVLRLYGGLAETDRARGHLLGRLPGWEALGLAQTDVGLGPKWSLKRFLRSAVSAPVEYRQALSSIRREHDRDPFDAFHLQYKREQILLTRPLSKLAPVVWTEHGTLSSGWKGRLLRPVYRLAARRVSHLVTVSDEVAESVNAAGVTCAVSTIFTAVDERRFRPASGAQERSAARDRIGVQTSATLVSVISRLHPHKRIERAIDAIGASERFRLLIAGTGPSEAALRAHAVDHPVDFLGWIDDPVDVHMACDIALLPLSPTEGLPTSLVEAAASGSVPVGFPGDLMSESVLAAGGVILEAGMTLDEVDWSDLASRQAAAVEWSADYRLDPWLRSHADVFDAAESRRPDRRT